MASPKRTGRHGSYIGALPLYWPQVERFIANEWPAHCPKPSRGWVETLFAVAHDPSIMRRHPDFCSAELFARCFTGAPDATAAFLAFAREIIGDKRANKRHRLQEWLLANDWHKEAKDSYGRKSTVGKLTASELADCVNAAMPGLDANAADVRNAETRLRTLEEQYWNSRLKRNAT